MQQSEVSDRQFLNAGSNGQDFKWSFSECGHDTALRLTDDTNQTLAGYSDDEG